ncbi:prephenate dehydrogenase [Ilumatobacter sp.]|uniref:prephenate dehydrogenase n=1 Tax=Ilumatobacter sp. TaxID=1967498 RepID=UPI00375236DF
MTSSPVQQRANVIGLGLIGGSIALALKSAGWRVSGDDTREPTVSTALDRGIIDASGLDVGAEITFVAVPVRSTTEEVKRALAETTGTVTDVGSVKTPVCRSVNDPRFIGGHPMAGSEFDGIDAAQADLFNSAVWVLTPLEGSDDATFAQVNGIISSLGADVVALSPERHDELVAVVSHVPHLAAATLMGLASTRSEEHAALLRLAAGGFRDMTRVASGQPGIWIDICAENKTAITSALSELIAGLSNVRDLIATDDHETLRSTLQAARDARTNLPTRVVHPEDLAEVRVPIPDRAGSAAELFTLAAELSVNIANFEVVHVAESNRGVAVVLIDSTKSEIFRGGLIARGFRPSVQALS